MLFGPMLLGACQGNPVAAPAASLSAGGSQASAAAKASSPSAQKTALKSGFSTTSASQAVLFGAKDGGFFDDEGLDVSISMIASGAPMLGAIQSGEAPLAFIASQDVIQADLQGGEYVLVAGFIDRILGRIWTKPTIETPQQLIDRTLGVSSIGSSSHTGLLLTLDKLGVPAAQVKILATGNPSATLASLRNGAIDGAPLNPPDDLVAQGAGLRQLVDQYALDLKSQSSVIATTRKYAAEHPDIVERYIRAAIKGSHRLSTDRAFAMKSLGKWLKVEDQAVLDGTVSYYQGKWGRDGALSPEGIQQNLDVAAKTIPAAKTAKPEQFIDTRFVEKIKSSGLVDQLWGKN